MASTVPGPEPRRATMQDRFNEPGEDLLTPRHHELRRLAAAMRRIIERLADTAASAEDIAAAADDLDEVAERFDRLVPGGDYEGFAELANMGPDVAAMVEKSPFIGQANPLAPPLRIAEVDGAIHAWGSFGSAYEGPPGCVHGGYVAAAFDEVLGAAQSLGGNPGMTGRLTVNYRSPTPLHTELHLIGELDHVEGRKTFTTGRLMAGDRLCAEAEGLFISVDFAKFVELKAVRGRGGAEPG